MPNYFVNKLDQGDGKHEVHASRCIFLPIAKTLSISLGQFNNCTDAIEAAKEYYKNVSGCFVCIQDGHLRKSEQKTEQYAQKKIKLADDENNSLAIPTKMGFDMVKSTNIIRCEAARAYCVFHLVGGVKITVAKSLNFFEAKLVEWNFYRVHKSNLVNIQHIEKYNRGKCSLVLSDKSEVPLSVRKKSDLIERLTFSSFSPKQQSRIAV